MKTRIVSLIFAGMFLFSCGGEDEVSNAEACEKALAEERKAKDAWHAKANAQPLPNSAPYVLEQYQKEVSQLLQVYHDKVTARGIACN